MPKVNKRKPAVPTKGSDNDFVSSDEEERSTKKVKTNNRKSSRKVEYKEESSESEEEDDDDSGQGTTRKTKKTAVKPKFKKLTAAAKKKATSTKRKRAKEEESEEADSDEEANSEGVASDTEVYNKNSVAESKLVIPRPRGSPFADALAPDTLQFMANLAENNDRDYMHLMEKEWRAAQKDFTDFCGLLMKEMAQVDPTIRIEDAKKAVYRQNRDLRFSNDKSPYKSNLSASFSRTGRKFLDGGYFISIKPGNQSMVAAGIWQPGKDMLERMRQNIIRDPTLLKEALSTDALKDIFDGKCGAEIMEQSDKLKNGPKGIEKDHPQIELLKFKSFAVCKSFTDEEVVSPGFLEHVMDVWEALVPFIHVINSWV